MVMKNRIKQLIEKLGVSAYCFASETGISKTTVYALKNNPDHFPSSDVFDKIIKTYNVRIDEIAEYHPD